MKVKEITIQGSRTINIGNYESRNASYGITFEITQDLETDSETAQRWIKEKLDRFENGWKNPAKEVRARVKDNNSEKAPF